MRWFWIDRFTEFACASHAVAVKCVSLSEEHMHEHMVGYPIMPNSLITEGMAQAGGLLVSEQYGFSELVVLGKLAKVKFHTCVRAGDTLTYRVEIESVRESGAAVTATAHVDGKLHAEALLFFARLNSDDDDSDPLNGGQLFEPDHLRHWLSLLRVFEIGTRKDGTRMEPSDYPLKENTSK